MHPDYIVSAMWETYRINLNALAAHLSGNPDPRALNIQLMEAENHGMEQLLDCFASRDEIDAVRREFRLPPRVWREPSRWRK